MRYCGRDFSEAELTFITKVSGLKKISNNMIYKEMIAI